MLQLLDSCNFYRKKQKMMTLFSYTKYCTVNFSPNLSLKIFSFLIFLFTIKVENLFCIYVCVLIRFFFVFRRFFFLFRLLSTGYYLEILCHLKNNPESHKSILVLQLLYDPNHRTNTKILLCIVSLYIICRFFIFCLKTFLEFIFYVKTF